MKKFRIPIILALFITLLALNSILKPVPSVHASSVNDLLTPAPTITVTQTPSPGGTTTTTLSQIFHHLVFPAETISKALAGIFDKAADKEVRNMSREIVRWTQVVGEIVQAPSQGDYNKVAQSSLPVAAALAPALFLLRLALYHWGRLLGDEDSGLRVVGDWVTAGVLAVASGPLLDLIVRLGWWMVGKVIGETGALAISFVKNTSANSILLRLANQTFLGSLLNIGLSIGSLLAIGGMLFAFASANAVLFILAVLAPPLAIASVLPQATWLRSLWMKAVVLISLLPIVAGGVFKAGLSASAWMGQQGLLSAIIRVVWLWGATGLLLSLAGILGKMTISTTADAFGGMIKAVQQIIAMGALAASGVGAAGTGAVGIAGAGTVTTSTATNGLTGAEATMSHLNAAQQLTQQAGNLDAMGLHAPAAYNRSLAHGHALAAQQAELGERMQRFGGTPATPPSQDFGFSPSVNSAIQSSFNGSPQEFQQGFQSMSTDLQQHGMDPKIFAAQYPEETAHMTRAYLDHAEEILTAHDPLMRASEIGKATQITDILTFMPNKKNDEEDRS